MFYYLYFLRFYIGLVGTFSFQMFEGIEQLEVLNECFLNLSNLWIEDYCLKIYSKYLSDSSFLIKNIQQSDIHREAL